MTICLTFDVEKWPVPEDYGVECGHDTSSLLCLGFSRLLRVLRDCGAHATFFICGDAMPDTGPLIKRALREGHEIAAHGKAHLNYTRLPIARFMAETKQHSKSMEDEFGVMPMGFRAPRCKINYPMLSALRKLGFSYDSSIHPTFIPRNYNYLGCPSVPFLVVPGLLEMQISVGLFKVPISWWWFRNFGRAWSSANTRILLNSGRNVVLYFHPWEFVRMPLLDGVPWHIYRHTGNILSEELERFISSFPQSSFSTLRSIRGSAPKC